MVILSKEELERYDRQLRVLGKGKQSLLKKSRILVVGAGGLGSSVLYYLVASGVGRIIVIDEGIVELSNLNRQVLYTTKDLGKYKVVVLKNKLRDLNPNVEIIGINEKFTEDLADKIIPNIDVAVDALDNWDSRFLLNKYCVKYHKPLVHAGVEESYGQLLTIIPGKGPCLQCVFPRKPRVRTPIPVLGPLPGILGAMEALEVIKIITGYGKPSYGKLVLFDGYHMSFMEVEVKRNPKCPVCSTLTTTTYSD